jgi:predicted RNase H-like HicB family nuclease
VQALGGFVLAVSQGCGKIVYMQQKCYTVSDGELVLTLEALPPEEGGGYGVRSPLEPQLVTEAGSIEEAFEMARDAIAALRESRQRYARRLAELAER